MEYACLASSRSMICNASAQVCCCCSLHCRLLPVSVLLLDLDLNRMVVGGGNVVKIWDLEELVCIAEFEGKSEVGTGHRSPQQLSAVSYLHTIPYSLCPWRAPLMRQPSCTWVKQMDLDALPSWECRPQQQHTADSEDAGFAVAVLQFLCGHILEGRLLLGSACGRCYMLDLATGRPVAPPAAAVGAAMQPAAVAGGSDHDGAVMCVSGSCYLQHYVTASQDGYVKVSSGSLSFELYYMHMPPAVTAVSMHLSAVTIFQALLGMHP